MGQRCERDEFGIDHRLSIEPGRGCDAGTDGIGEDVPYGDRSDERDERVGPERGGQQVAGALGLPEHVVDRSQPEEPGGPLGFALGSDQFGRFDAERIERVVERSAHGQSRGQPAPRSVGETRRTEGQRGFERGAISIRRLAIVAAREEDAGAAGMRDVVQKDAVHSELPTDLLPFLVPSDRVIGLPVERVGRYAHGQRADQAGEVFGLGERGGYIQ